MTFRFAVVLPLVALLAACSSSPSRESASAPAPQPTADTSKLPYEILRKQQDFPLAEGTTLVRVVNPHGNIGVKNVGEPLLGVQSVVQVIGANGERPVIAVEQQGATALVRVHYASDANGHVDDLVEGHRKGRVDLAIFVPKGVEVDVETTYGNIDVRRIDNNIRTRSREGRAVVATAGAMDVTTDSGRVRAWPMAGKWTKPMRITTRTGEIFSDIPGYGEIALEARSGGRVEADFEVERTREGNEDVVRWKNASGAQKIEIRSESGPISLQFASRPPTPE